MAGDENAEAAAMAMIITDPGTEPTTVVRVGAYSWARPGPLGTTTYESERIGSHSYPYQEVGWRIIHRAIARIDDPDGAPIEIPWYNVPFQFLDLIDGTMRLVPPGHLRLVSSRKPEGFICANTAGRFDAMRYTGGLNAPYNDPATPDLNERNMIIITYGALWNWHHLGISPTTLHEIGHVMTHRGEINYGPFGAEREAELRALPASRNQGEQEGLVNTYMYFLCYGSSNPALHRYGRGGTIEKDATTRAALRRCRAFRPPLLSASWESRFAER
jgi:hypothetical protein